MQFCEIRWALARKSYMVIEIEYYKGDTLLYGPKVSFEAFRSQVKTIERLYDKREDNFVALLCRMYDWEVFRDEVQPQYVYDRDVQKCVKVHSDKGNVYK